MGKGPACLQIPVLKLQKQRSAASHHPLVSRGCSTPAVKAEDAGAGTWTPQGHRHRSTASSKEEEEDGWALIVLHRVFGVRHSFSPVLALAPPATFTPSANFHSSVNKNEGAAQRGAHSSVKVIKITQFPASTAGHTFLDRKTQHFSRHRQQGKFCARTSWQSWEPLSSLGMRRRTMMMMSLVEVQAQVCSPGSLEHVQTQPLRHSCQSSV